MKGLRAERWGKAILSVSPFSSSFFFLRAGSHVQVILRLTCPPFIFFPSLSFLPPQHFLFFPSSHLYPPLIHPSSVLSLSPLRSSLFSFILLSILHLLSSTPHPISHLSSFLSPPAHTHTQTTHSLTLLTARL